MLVPSKRGKHTKTLHDLPIFEKIREKDHAL